MVTKQKQMKLKGSGPKWLFLLGDEILPAPFFFQFWKSNIIVSNYQIEYSIC